MMKQLSVGGTWERRRPARNRKAQICRRRRRILPITPPDNVIDIDTSSDKAFESVGSNAPRRFPPSVQAVEIGFPKSCSTIAPHGAHSRIISDRLVV
jgi:hypothetical protein